MITSKQQQEIAGWFRLALGDYNPAVTYLPIMLPRADEHTVIDFSNEGETKYIITERLLNSQLVNKTYLIKVGTEPTRRLPNLFLPVRACADDVCACDVADETAPGAGHTSAESRSQR